MTKFTIGLEEETRQKLKDLKKPLGAKTFNEVVNLLIQYYNLREREAQAHETIS